MVGIDEILIYNIIPLIFLIIIYFIWKKYGEDEKVNSITSKYPPNNLNILQVSYLYTDDINDEDFTPFMIQLAKEGYIKIIKDKKNYKIIKIKTPKEEIKSYFIKELFKDKEEIDIKNFKNRISKLMNIVKKKIESKYEVENVYESKSLSKKSLTKFMIFIIYIMSILKLLIDLKNIKLFLLCIIIPCIGISILFKNSKSKKLNIKIIEDVAQAWNLKDNNGINNIGIDSDIVVTSFGSTKPISYGIGGGLFFDNEKIFKEIDFCDNESREKQGIILSYAYPLCKEIKLDYLLEKANEIVDEQRLCAREYSNVLLNQKTIKYINYEQNSGNVWHRFPMWIENQKTFEKIKKILEKSTLEFQFEHDVKLTDLPMCQKCIKYNENTHYYFILVRTRNVNIENQVKNLKKLIDLLKND